MNGLSRNRAAGAERGAQKGLPRVSNVNQHLGRVVMVQQEGWLGEMHWRWTPAQRARPPRALTQRFLFQGLCSLPPSERMTFPSTTPGPAEQAEVLSTPLLPGAGTASIGHTSQPLPPRRAWDRSPPHPTAPHRHTLSLSLPLPSQWPAAPNTPSKWELLVFKQNEAHNEVLGMWMQINVNRNATARTSRKHTAASPGTGDTDN